MLIKYHAPTKHDMFCPFCGNEIDDKAAFCPYCGSKISSVQPPSSEPMTPLPETSISGKPIGSISPEPVEGFSQTSLQKPIQTGDKTWSIYYTFIVLLLIGAVTLLIGLLILSALDQILNDPQFQSTTQQFGGDLEEVERMLRIISYSFVIVGVISIAGGVGTMMLKPWGRILATVSYVLLLLSRNPLIIILAVIGLYGLWFHAKTKLLFSKEPSPQWDIK